MRHEIRKTSFFMEPYEKLKAHPLCVCYNSLTFTIANEQTWYDPVSSISLNRGRNVCKFGVVLVLLRTGSIFRHCLALTRYKKILIATANRTLKWLNLILIIFCVSSYISFASLALIWCRWHKQAGLLLRRIGFSTGPNYVTFMVDKFTNGTSSLHILKR